MNPPEVTLASHRVRVGCDVVELAAIEYSLHQFGQRYLDKMFTAREQADCRGTNRIERLAARFAAKEATVKAFGVPDGVFVPRELEVVTAQSVPRLLLTGAAERLAAEQGWTEVSLSLSHADCHAAAVVVVVCTESVADPHPSSL